MNMMTKTWICLVDESASISPTQNDMTLCSTSVVGLLKRELVSGVARVTALVEKQWIQRRRQRIGKLDGHSGRGLPGRVSHPQRGDDPQSRGDFIPENQEIKRIIYGAVPEIVIVPKLLSALQHKEWRREIEIDSSTLNEIGGRTV